MNNDIVLRYSHNIIELLGLKLYQNKPTNVIAELVSNAWDADAENVWIDIHMNSESVVQYIAVGDDGFGIDIKTLVESYLIIGKPKRTYENVDAKTPKGRKLMGRKGIGKLAPFGIAHCVDLFTISQINGSAKATWIRLDFNEILREQEKTETERKGGEEKQARYRPKTIMKEEDLSGIPDAEDATGAVSRFVGSMKQSSGTLVLMTGLSLKRKLSVRLMKEAMGRRFTVTLMRDDFNVFINSEILTEKEALPAFEMRIPENEGITSELVDILGNKKEVKYWVGFVKQAEWPQDQAGVGIYAHGKIAQDRPFFFGLKGKEIWSRYVYGVIEADWLDELKEDIVSTDRTSVDWNNDEAAVLQKWGKGKLRNWIKKYIEKRRETEEDENVKRVSKITIPKVTTTERVAIAKMLTEVTPELGKNEKTKDKLAATVTQAWLHRPMRKLIKDLWDQLNKEETVSGDIFIGIVSKLTEHAVPEALSLAVMFAQRAYALSLLYEMKHRGKEPDLQKLIETFPWILNPDMGVLTKNQTIKTVIQKAQEEGLIATHINASDENDNIRPDFVYLSKGDESRIVVVEIKSPRKELNIENREQLAAYLTHLEITKPNAALSGQLIGSNPNRIVAQRKDMEIFTWDEVFVNSRIKHIELLAAMLTGSNPDSADARIEDVVQFGGEKTLELLKRMAAKDEQLNDLIEQFESANGKDGK